MGTAGFAVKSLENINEHENHQVLAVVTAADKKGGRGMKQLLSSPVKDYAEKNDLPLLQPTNLKDENFLEQLKSFEADLFVVVAFRMLPELVWSIPPKGTINLHSSLLPKYRGAAPINWAIIKGETETGVSTFMIDKSIDTGSILLQRKAPIYAEDNAQTLHDRLMELGANVLVDTLKALEKGNITPLPQEEKEVTHAPKIFKETCLINFQDSAVKVHDFVRGLSPYPGAWMQWGAVELKIFETQIIDEISTALKPGTLFLLGKNDLRVQCGDGTLKIKVAQIQGKKRMEAYEIINGHRNVLPVINTDQ